MLIERPPASEFGAYYRAYVDEVPEVDILEFLERQSDETQALIGSLDETEALYRYAPGKWSVKEVLGHLADSERVFACRALCFARAEPSHLPGFDENEYVAAASFDSRPLASLASELHALRRASLTMFGGLNEEELLRRGVANEVELSVRAIAYILAGHERHHLAVLGERYRVR